MGVKAKFQTIDVEKALRKRGKASTLKLRNALGHAAFEVQLVSRMLTPRKTGTLEHAIRLRRETPDKYVVWIDESAPVPGRDRKVSDYLRKIESGDFRNLGKISLAKEGAADKRRLAGLRVQRSPQGTYVGGIFFDRTVDAIRSKWDERFKKIFKAAMENGQI